MIPAEAFEPILTELRRRPLELNMCRNTAGEGRSQAFGVVNRRSCPPDYSRQCWSRPLLYKLLLEFGEKYVDVSFNAITLNQNYKAAPHYDKNNSGQSFLVAFGNFSGGQLEILEEGEDKGIYDIRNTPIKRDFSKLLHCVKDWEGERYSLVYYNFKHPRWEINLPPPSVREVDGKLRFFRGEEMIKDGLPHPLRGRKKS